jgi:putative endonuclease
MLKCSDDFIYVGITNNLLRRLDEHQSGNNTMCYTHKRRPVTLIFKQEFHDVKQAILFEKKLKKWSRAKKLALSENDVLALKRLSQCKNASNFENF